jgi:hypothetical protein
VEIVASRLQAPWSVVFAPDGRILFWVNDLACDRLLHFRYGRIREVSEGPDGYIAEDWND